MRKAVVLLVIVTSLVLATFSTTSGQRGQSGEGEPTATNTDAPNYLPVLLSQPTFTPTATATPTATPTATDTASPCGTGFNGHLELTVPKPSYATYIENVKFNEYLHNPTGTTICFGILGLSVSGPQTLPFKTSWDGAGATGGRLEIWAGCYGPAGLPCAGSSAAGRHEDNVGDDAEQHTPWEITTPGTYNATLYVCYSPYSTCIGGQGAHWAAVSGAVPFTMVHWTPSAPQTDGQAEPTPKPFGGLICYLNTDDPDNIYLKCDGKQSEGAPRVR